MLSLVTDGQDGRSFSKKHTDDDRERCVELGMKIVGVPYNQHAKRSNAVLFEAFLRDHCKTKRASKPKEHNGPFSPFVGLMRMHPNESQYMASQSKAVREDSDGD